MNHFFWNVFYYELTPGGPIREVRVDALDFDACGANRAPLVEAWTRATNAPLADDQVAAILADLKHRSRTPEEAPDIPAVFRKQVGAGIDEGILAGGMDAFFKKAIEMDGDVLRERPGMDVSLRESLRIAADWARIQPATTSKQSDSPPSTPDRPASRVAPAKEPPTSAPPFSSPSNQETVPATPTSPLSR